MKRKNLSNDEFVIENYNITDIKSLAFVFLSTIKAKSLSTD